MTKLIRKPGPGGARLHQALQDIDGHIGKVGWFESSKYQDGTPVAYVAAIHEHGVPEKGIAMRATMRPTAQAQRAQWAKLAQQGYTAVFRGTDSTAAVMEKVSAKAAGDIRRAISRIRTPPLKVATVKARLRDKKQGRVVSLTAAKPLVDSGVLLNTLTHIVEDKS
ncbi:MULTISPECIES: hypothetical protein [Burkholderiaceae]|uniref:hypothetical protein n=1 Tax=Burkholderiaceae TaxID=119060 RepID=UPI000960D23A|nr:MULTISPECIES: hypothetical protein [Burkholderiaceae]MCG1038791.1 hypothetical protein [Mycetohabitans sp. B7]SIT68906.1 hypothetical protein SAMN04487769_1406 [Burkholderia sp. b14]